MQQFIWSSQGRAIWEVASKLQEDAIQVDVCLHTPAGGCEMVNTNTTHKVLTKKKKVHKDYKTFPAHKLILAAASPFLKKVQYRHFLIWGPEDLHLLYKNCCHTHVICQSRYKTTRMLVNAAVCSP